MYWLLDITSPLLAAGAICLLLTLHRLIGLHRWSAAQRPSTRATALVYCGCAWATFLWGCGWLEGSLWVVGWLVGCGGPIVSRVIARRIGYRLSKPLLLPDTPLFRRQRLALDHALFPQFRRAPRPALDERPSRFSHPTELRDSEPDFPHLELPGEGLSCRVKRLTDLLIAIPLSLVLLPILAVLATCRDLLAGGRSSILRFGSHLARGPFGYSSFAP